MIYKIEVLVRYPETKKIAILKTFVSGFKIVNKFLYTLEKMNFDIGGYTIKSVLN